MFSQSLRAFFLDLSKGIKSIINLYKLIKIKSSDHIFDCLAYYILTFCRDIHQGELCRFYEGNELVLLEEMVVSFEYLASLLFSGGLCFYWTHLEPLFLLELVGRKAVLEQGLRGGVDLLLGIKTQHRNIQETSFFEHSATFFKSCHSGLLTGKMMQDGYQQYLVNRRFSKS